jgi:hypothetical protein
VGHEVLGDAVVGIVEQDSHVPCRLPRNVYPFPGKQPASFGTLRFVLSDHAARPSEPLVLSTCLETDLQMARQTKCAFKISQLLSGDARDGRVAGNFLPITARMRLRGVPDLCRIQAVGSPASPSRKRHKLINEFYAQPLLLRGPTSGKPGSTNGGLINIGQHHKWNIAGPGMGRRRRDS